MHENIRQDTIRAVLTRIESRLAASGVDSPRLSAQLLVARALGTDRMRLFLDMDKVLSSHELAMIEPLVARRGAGEPAAYILGVKEFYGLDFEVTPDVLIPRPETEMLVEEALGLLDQNAGTVLADLGTGSGILAVTVAVHRPNAHVLAIDLSPGALSVARRNGMRHHVAERIGFVRADFGQLPVMDESLDLVLANPPYLAQAELDQVSPEVSGFEPICALVAGMQGDEALLSVEHAARRALAPGGTLLMEIGWEQGERAACLFGSEAGFTWHDVRVLKDLSGHDRILRAVR